MQFKKIINFKTKIKIKYQTVSGVENMEGGERKK